MMLRFVKTGLRYCIRHHGIVDVDEDVCDFADNAINAVIPGAGAACDLRQLGYRTRRR